jgi:hypothetical protein
MPSLHATQDAPSSSSTNTAAVKNELPPDREADPLDRYAREFAELVRQHPPERGEEHILTWPRRVPDEVFRYYRSGIRSYGREARTPVERRGRLYLMHTTLLFMWMDWGRSMAEERFRARTARGTRRTASLITLELYRRAGVLDAIEVGDWFWQPVEDWEVRLIREAVSPSNVSRASLRKRLSETPVVSCPVGTFSELRTHGAVPSLTELTLGGE